MPGGQVDLHRPVLGEQGGGQGVCLGGALPDVRVGRDQGDEVLGVDPVLQLADEVPGHEELDDVLGHIAGRWNIIIV